LGTYFAIVTCRNSEANIEEALLSLKEQSVLPLYVIVIDDGSRDKTPEILRRMQKGWASLHVITNPDLGYNIARVVSNWNKAMQHVRESGLPGADYHMIGTDDTVYEKDYAEKMLRYMEADMKIGIASGDYGQSAAVTPHGAGRFVRSAFFDRHHGLYPEKMGYESLVLHTAARHGYTYRVFADARFTHTRPLGKNHHFYEFGASMRTLGYHPLFALGRCALYFANGRPIGRLGALYMLYHYLSYRPKDAGYDSMYDKDTRQFIRGHQLQRIKRRIGA
jgi:glycosyltransferase involved in cell wall biosynthesis